MRRRAFFVAARSIAQSAGQHRIGVVAAGMAFYTLLALVPTAITMGLLASVLLSRDEVAEAAANFGDTLEQATTSTAGDGIWEPLIQVASTAPSIGLFTVSGLFALLVAVYSSSRVLVTLRQTLDIIFGIPEERNGLLLRAFSAVVALVALVVFAAAAVAFVIVPRLVSFDLPFQFGDDYWQWGLLAVLMTVAVRMLFTYGPHHRRHAPPRQPVGWTDAGVLVAAGWILATSALLGVIVSLSSGPTSVILVFGAPIILLLWLNTVLLGILVGAEVTAYRRHAARADSTPHDTHRAG